MRERQARSDQRQHHEPGRLDSSRHALRGAANRTRYAGRGGKLAVGCCDCPQSVEYTDRNPLERPRKLPDNTIVSRRSERSQEGPANRFPLDRHGTYLPPSHRQNWRKTALVSRRSTYGPEGPMADLKDEDRSQRPQACGLWFAAQPRAFPRRPQRPQGVAVWCALRARVSSKSAKHLTHPNFFAAFKETLVFTVCVQRPHVAPFGCGLWIPAAFTHFRHPCRPSQALLGRCAHVRAAPTPSSFPCRRPLCATSRRAAPWRLRACVA